MMIIRGKERGFELNVQSHADIEQLCPGNDFGNFQKLFEGKTQGEMITIEREIAVILNKGYEDHKAYEDPNYKQDYLQNDDMKFMTIVEFNELEKELMLTISSDARTTVEAKEPASTGKKNKGQKA